MALWFSFLVQNDPQRTFTVLFKSVWHFFSMEIDEIEQRMFLVATKIFITGEKKNFYDCMVTYYWYQQWHRCGLFPRGFQFYFTVIQISSQLLLHG